MAQLQGFRSYGAGRVLRMAQLQRCRSLRSWARFADGVATKMSLPTELDAFRGWRGYKDFAPTELGPFCGWRSYKDFAPTELGAICGPRSYKDFAPTELVGERLLNHNAELTATADIIVDSAENSLK
jgi:hypothetical protein